MQESKSCALPLGYAPILAVSVGFEPTDAFTSPVFKTGVIDHSTNLPMERMAGIEPVLPAWRAGALTIELHSRMAGNEGLEPTT